MHKKKEYLQHVIDDPSTSASDRLAAYADLYEAEGMLEEAYQAYLTEAEKGNAEAMFFIGNLYFFSQYEAKPDPTALLRAMFNNGGVVMPWNLQNISGQKIPNYPKAREWYFRAAEAGFVSAMVNAACMAYEGQGGPKDIQSARRLLTRAAETGYKRAIGALRDLFGVDPNIAYSMEEYRDMLRDFENEKGDLNALYYNLMLGSPAQLFKLGYVLAKLRYTRGGLFEKFSYAMRQNARPYAPIEHFRFAYYSTFVIHLDAFEEGISLVIAYDDGISDSIDTLKWAYCGSNEADSILEPGIKYCGVPFSWMEETRVGSLIRIGREYGCFDEPNTVCGREPDLFLDRNSSFRVGHMELCKELKGENVAIIGDDHEKEFAVEIVEYKANDFIPIFRYEEN